jgi:SAM-dependent methyltransferase
MGTWRHAQPALCPDFGGALLLDSFGFFDQDDENLLVLQEARRIVRPKGRLVIAVANGTPILADFRAHEEERRGSVVFEIDRTLRHDPAQLIERITVREPSDTAHYERRQRLYTCRDLIALLKVAAFDVRAVSADYGGRRFDDAVSPKMVILAEAGS